MKIILDSNIIIADFWMSGTNFQVLFETFEKNGDDICIPQIVIDEVLNKYKQKFYDAKKDLDKASDEIRKLTGNKQITQLDIEIIESFIKNYKKHIDSLISNKKLIVLPYPKVSHQEVAKRAMKKRKPFKDNGDGYRDVIIWENIKEQLSYSEEKLVSTEIIFITHNHKDFATKDYKLDKDLINDLAENDFNENSVIIYPNLGEYIENRPKTELQVLDDIKAKIENRGYHNFNLRSTITNYLFDKLIGQQFEPEKLDIRHEFEGTTIESINEDFTIKSTSVKRLSKEKIIIDVEFELDVRIALFVFKGDYWILDDADMPSIVEKDWNDHYMLCELEKSIDIELSLVMGNNMDLISQEITKINENYI